MDRRYKAASCAPNGKRNAIAPRFVLLLFLSALLFLFSGCAQSAPVETPAPETPAPTPVPTPEPTPKIDLPDELVGDWSLCIGDGDPGNGAVFDSFTLSADGTFSANGESREGYLAEVSDDGILTYVTEDGEFMLKSVEKGGLALFYRDWDRNVFTSKSQQFFYKDFTSAELTAENWQDYFECRTVYELIKNSLNVVTSFNVRIYLVPHDTLDVLSVRGGKVSALTTPTAYALIEYQINSCEYSLSKLPRSADKTYGKQRLQYAKTGMSAEGEFHNFAMDFISGWAANIYARNESEYVKNGGLLTAAVESEFKTEILSISGTICYRDKA